MDLVCERKELSLESQRAEDVSSGVAGHLRFDGGDGSPL